MPIDVMEYNTTKIYRRVAETVQWLVQRKIKVPISHRCVLY